MAARATAGLMWKPCAKALLGHAQRGAGKATGQEASFNQAALRVETAGERANALIDGASHEAAVLTDKAGDGAKRAASEAADDVKRTSDKRDMADQVGEAADAWRSHGEDLACALDSMGGLAKGISNGLGVAGFIVQFVHDMVRDAIAEAGRTIADLFNR